MENILAPKHEILNAKDAKEVLEFYRIDSAELPKIKKDDPAIKGMKAEVGDVIRITRESHTAGQSLYYRVVIGE